MNDPVRKIVAMAGENADDLKILGLLFLRLLQADFHVMSTQPSATLMATLSLEERGEIGLEKKLADLIKELDATGAPMLTDGYFGSILRMFSPS